MKSALGAASVERAGAALDASAGFELQPGDVLVTGADGRLGITFVDSSRFSIGPDSRIILTQFEYDPTSEQGSFVTEVVKGTMAAVSGRILKSSGRGGMLINTPEATLGVENAKVVVKVK